MEKEDSLKPKIVQTYAEDMAKVIGDDRGGLIKKIIHSEEEHEKEKMNRSPESKRNKVYMFLSLVLLFLGLGVLLFLVLREDVKSVLVEEQVSPIIFSDKIILIELKDLKKEQAAAVFLKEVTKSEVKQGGVVSTKFLFKNEPIGVRKFLLLIKSTFFPGEIAFVSDDFLIGGVRNDEGKDFFMILKMRGITDIFSNLRVWENKMFLDLHEFLGIGLTLENNYLLTKNLEDGVIKNKNARILYDNSGEVVLMYIFADENTVVISATEKSAEEIMRRLAKGKIEQ